MTETENIKQIIDFLFSKDENERKKAKYLLGDVLEQEIRSAVKGQKKARSFGLTFEIYCRRGNSADSKQRQFVKLFDQEKDFTEPFNLLFLRFFETIIAAEEAYHQICSQADLCPDSLKDVFDSGSPLTPKQKTILKGLYADEVERKKFIRYNLGLILHNNVFKEIVENHKKRSRHAIKELKEKFKSNFDIRTIYRYFAGPDSPIIQFSPVSRVASSLFLADTFNQTTDTGSPKKWIAQNENRLDEIIKELLDHSSTWQGYAKELSIATDTPKEEIIRRIIEDLQNIRTTLINQYGGPVAGLPLTTSNQGNDAHEWTGPEISENKLYAEELFDLFYAETEDDRISKQKAHFFWKPGEAGIWNDTLPDALTVKEVFSANKAGPVEIRLRYKDQEATTPSPDKEMSNQELCVWLMYCSFLTMQQLANIYECDVSTIFRWLRQPLLLKFPFGEEDFPPVFFDMNTRESIGQKSKETCWKIYKFLKSEEAPDIIDRVDQKGPAFDDKLSFVFKVCGNTSIDEIASRKDEIFQVVYITDIR